MKQKFLTAYVFMVALAALLVVPSDANAGEPRLLATHGNWSAYIVIEDGNKVCYMASKPTKDEGNYTKRGDIFALITHRPAEGTRDVFSYITGYSYKEGSEASVDIGSDHFVLFTQGDTAWTPDEKSDRELSEAIKKGSNMVVRGVSSRGTNTKDTFSLKGSSAAYERISKECS